MARGPNRARRVATASFPSPVAGWISNRNLAQPEDGNLPPGAEVLDNFFPTSTGVKLRRGCSRYATLETNGVVRSLFTYSIGGNERLFASDDSYIYDITAVPRPYGLIIGEPGRYRIGWPGQYVIGETSTSGLNLYPSGGNGNWNTLQFGTTGGTWLLGVNGSSTGFVFDGEWFYPDTPDGVTTVNYSDSTGALEDGETVTGGTSGATATVWRDEIGGAPGSGRLVLINVTGSFSADETVEGSSSGNTVKVVSSAVVAGGTSFSGGLTTADMSFVWAYKDRVYYIESESLNVWYGDVDAYQGAFKLFPMNGIFSLGGSLLFGSSWSLASSDSGGMSAQCVFVTTEGEVAVFQGTSPDDAQTWRLVGVYRIGKPLGDKAVMRAGGDLVIATSTGFIPLSKAIQVDMAALSPVAVSYPIDQAWSDALEARGREGWISAIWPDLYMGVVVPPRSTEDPVAFVVNARTGAWGRYTGWDIRSMAVHRGQLYFGSTGGKVFTANVTGRDDGDMYAGRVIPLFRDFNASASYRAGRMARTDTRSNVPFNERVTALYDWNMDIPPPPRPAIIQTGNEWENAIWDQSVWSASAVATQTQKRHSIGGYGYRMSLCYQVSSDSVTPLDVELVELDATYELAQSFT